MKFLECNKETSWYNMKKIHIVAFINISNMTLINCS